MTATPAEWKAVVRVYWKLVNQKREAFCKSLVTQQGSTPRRMWKSIDKLLGHGGPPADAGITAVTFHDFFDKKVADIRASTSNAAPPEFVETNCVFPGFQPVSPDDVAAAVRGLPSKQCATHPIPTWLLKECADDLAPFLCHLFNRSLQSDVVLAALKSAYICPSIKKS